MPVLNVMVTPVALAFLPVPVVMMVVVVTAGAGAVVRATSLPETKSILPSVCSTIRLLMLLGMIAAPLVPKVVSRAPVGVRLSSKPPLGPPP